MLTAEPDCHHTTTTATYKTFIFLELCSFCLNKGERVKACGGRCDNHSANSHSCHSVMHPAYDGTDGARCRRGTASRAFPQYRLRYYDEILPKHLPSKLLIGTHTSVYELRKYTHPYVLLYVSNAFFTIRVKPELVFPRYSGGWSHILTS